MADKNLHDIKIDDLDNPPKTPLKNILTLLALLFIILVISVVITRLILNPDNEEKMESNISTTSLTGTEIDSEANTNNTTSSNNTQETSNHETNTAAIAAATAVTAITASSATKKDEVERNVSGSKIKVRLREHVPPSAVKELPVPKKVVTTPKKPKTEVKKAPSASVKHTPKQYIDKVVATNNSKSPSLNHSVEGQKRPGYYIKVGTFKDISTALNKIKKTGLNYILIKPKDAKNVTRVLIGPFKSNWAADRHLASVQHNIAKGAYITRIK